MNWEAWLVAALQNIPAIVSAGEDVANYVENAITVYKSGVAPTKEQWDALNAALDANSAIIQAPIPPEVP